MRKVNAVTTVLLIVLFLMHGIFGAMNISGIGFIPMTAVTYIFVLLLAVHIVIGVMLTVRTIRVKKKTGVSYPKENRLFWARRISGFAIMIFMLVHFVSFSYTDGDTLRLHRFDALRLTGNIMLVLSLAVHIISNARPAMIALGIKRLREYAADILVVLSVLLAFMGAAFVVYFIRWNFV